MIANEFMKIRFIVRRLETRFGRKLTVCLSNYYSVGLYDTGK